MKIPRAWCKVLNLRSSLRTRAVSAQAKPFWIVGARALLSLGLVIFSSAARATESKYLDDLIQRVEQEKAYREPGWNKILFMANRWLGPTASLFDDPNFFLSGPGGRYDARAEMIAALRRFAAPELVKIGPDERHPQCFYAARFEYLKKRFNLDPKRFTFAECPHLDKFLRFATYSGVSLVFSNYFADNPASMFGHTLLRLRHSQNASEMGLLDDAANYAAQVPVINPLTYPFQGLFGLFQGRFALLPYSEKIQEYNNFESRDLWEYSLNLSPDEIHRLVLELWEVGSFTMHYYYLEKNCSYIILSLLEAIRPSLNLVDQFHVYAIPSDTIKAVANEPGLVGDIQFKPSARTRYLARARDLDAGERKLFARVLKRFAASASSAELETALGACTTACRVKIFDALIEFIDFKEKKFSTRKMRNYEALRRQVLVARSRIQQRSAELNDRPEKSRPDLGPRSSMVEAQSGFTQKGFNISELRWRPALHDISSSAAGYSNELEIEVLDTVIANSADLRQTYLKRLTVLEFQSLGKHELELSPLAWRADIGYNTDRSFNDPTQLYSRTGLSVGLGDAREVGPFGAFLLLNVSGGYSSDPNLHWHLGVGPFAGAYWTFSDNLKFTTLFNWTKSYGVYFDERREVVSRLVYSWRKENEFSLDYRDQDNFYYWGAGYRIYF